MTQTDLTGANCGVDPAKAMQSKIDLSNAQYKQYVLKWQDVVTGYLQSIQSDLLEAVHDLPALIEARVQEAAEPIREQQTLLGLQIIFIAIVLGFVVFYYK